MTTDGRPRVFLSYSSGDGAEFATRLRDALTDAEVNVYHFATTAHPGEQAWSRVAEGISRSDYFVALLTRESTVSKPVKAEIELAFHSWVNSDDNRPSLIPVLLHDVDVPQLLKTRVPVALAHSDRAIADILGLIRQPEAEETRGPETGALSATLSATPRRARVGDEVYWHANAVNRGSQGLHDVILRLGRTPIAGPVDIGPHKEFSIDVPVVYDSPGTKQRTLTVVATTDRGLKAEASTKRRIKVEERRTSSNDLAGSEFTPEGTVNRPERLGQIAERILDPSTRLPPEQSSRASQLLPGTDEERPDRLPPLRGMLTAAGVVGLVGSVIGLFAIRWLSSLLTRVTLLGIDGWPESVAEWPSWVFWVTGVGLILAMFVAGGGVAEFILVLDASETVWATIVSVVIAVTVASLWVWLFDAEAWIGALMVLAAASGVGIWVAVEES